MTCQTAEARRSYDQGLRFYNAGQLPAARSAFLAAQMFCPTMVEAEQAISRVDAALGLPSVGAPTAAGDDMTFSLDEAEGHYPGAVSGAQAAVLQLMAAQQQAAAAPGAQSKPGIVPATNVTMPTSGSTSSLPLPTSTPWYQSRNVLIGGVILAGVLGYLLLR